MTLKNETTSIGKDRSTSVGDNETLEVGKKIVISAGDEIALKTDSATITMQKNGYHDRRQADNHQGVGGCHL